MAVGGYGRSVDLLVARTATSLSACDGGPLAVGDAVELQNINAAPALNGKTGTVTVSAQIKFLRDGAVGFSRIDFHTDHCD